MASVASMARFTMALLAVLTAMAILGFAATLVAGPAAAEDVVARGTFEGRSNHVTKGGVTITRTAEGAVVVLERDFSLDGAPDPKLGFGNDGYDSSTQFSPLRSNTGKQEYTQPASIDPATYNEIWVWCERFSVPLGVAELK